MRWAWATAAVIFVVGLAGLVYLRGGPPKLVEGHSTQAGAGQWRDNTSAEDLPPRTLLLHYQQGQSASFTLSVRNAGRRPVKLTGAYVLGSRLMFAARRARFEPAPGESDHFRPATSVEVPGGGEVAVVVSGEFTNCSDYQGGSETSTQTLSVDYRDGDAIRTALVPLRDEIRVIAPDSCS
jgi:hypothetical protein